MDMVTFQEKMDPTHRTYFCRMLKMKVLPDCLLELYVRVKKMADRMDAHLSPGELVLVAVMAGFNPEAGKFCVTGQSVDELVDRPLDEAADQVLEETLEETAKPTVEKAPGEVDPTRESIGLPTAQKQQQPPA